MKKGIAILLTMLLVSVPVSAERMPQYAPLFEASFLQGWYCRDWTAERWITELEDMQTAGFRSVILQSTVDLTYEQTDLSKPKTDAASYQQTAAYALYPSALVPGSGEMHTLEYALEAARQTNMQVYIGTVSDNRWWNYGWGAPDAYFAEWTVQNGAQCAAVISEIRNLYGSAYDEQIAGFYYHNEIWNMDTACAGPDAAQYAELIGGNIRQNLEQIAELFPDKPMLISPFYNRDLSSPEEYAAFWNKIASYAQFRTIDIFALQDGSGRDYDTETVFAWNQALSSVMAESMQFWVNHETFDSGYAPGSMETLRQNYLAVNQAKKHILFSWNHYYHDQLPKEFEKLLQKMTGDVNGDGFFSVADVVTMQRWLMRDRIAVSNWIAGDLDANGIWSAADLSLMKRRLLYN